MKARPLFLILSLFAFAATLTSAEERPAIYPFDVTVGGQDAVFNSSFPIFAKIPGPVAADAEVILDAEPEAIIVNIFPCEANGTVPRGVDPKVIMAGKATSFKLNQTLDKSTLAPGLYGMNIVLRSKGTSRVMFRIGEGAAPATPTAPAIAGAPNQSTPESTLEAVFAAAK